MLFLAPLYYLQDYWPSLRESEKAYTLGQAYYILLE
jgi:hypothetical protein